MRKSFKPKGYNAVSPYFIVKGAQEFIDQIITIFDAQELRRFNRLDGSVMHAELQIDDSVIMLSDATETYPAISMVLHVYVPNVDVIFKKAEAAGCEIIEKPKQNEGDPDRRATFMDLAGNMWSIGTQI